MRADWTVTFTAPKVGQVMAPACEHLGALTVARIGTADSVLDGLPGPRLLLTEPADVRSFTAPRSRSGHKGTYGHVLAIGGSLSKPGAILMTATTALKAGAGLATVATAAGASAAILAAAPELMLEPLDELPDGTLGPDCFKQGWFAGKSVVAVGPGLGSWQLAAEPRLGPASLRDMRLAVGGGRRRPRRDAARTAFGTLGSDRGHAPPRRDGAIGG